MASLVTEYLLQLIAKQVDERGLVVWYDPEQAYRDVVEHWLSLPIADRPLPTVAYGSSFLKLRKEIDHLMADGQPPRLVVYVPIEREKTDSALIELDCAGVVMQPRQQPPACNTRLSVVARNALKPILGDDQVGEIERQVEAGKLSLTDLNSLAEQGIDISTGVVKLIFDSANPQEVALAFLHSDQHDGEIEKKEAGKELRHLLQVSYDIELPSAEALSNWRVKLGRHVLLTDLFAALKKDTPSSLASVSVAHSTSGVDACVRLTRTWRNSREHRDSYVALANKVDQELSLVSGQWSVVTGQETAGQNDRVRESQGKLGQLPIAAVQDCETLLRVEQQLIHYVEASAIRHPSHQLLQLAQDRMSGFWSEVTPTIQARWALTCSAIEVLLHADRVARELKSLQSSSTTGKGQLTKDKSTTDHGQLTTELVKAYADDDQPWCLLDTHHRHMESRKYNFEFDAGNDHHGLEKLITKAEQRYTQVGSELAKHFITQFSKAKHPIPGRASTRSSTRCRCDTSPTMTNTRRNSKTSATNTSTSPNTSCGITTAC